MAGTDTQVKPNKHLNPVMGVEKETMTPYYSATTTRTHSIASSFIHCQTPIWENIKEKGRKSERGKGK